MTLQTVFLLTDKKIVSLNPNELVDHKLNREVFSKLGESEYRYLKEDIENRNIQDPLHVRKIGEDTYQVICGHQRKNIAVELGWNSIPCIIRDDLKEEWQVEEQLIRDNLNRRQMSDPEIGKATEYLLKIEKQKAKERMSKGGKQKGAKDFAKNKKPERATDKVAKQFGKSGRQLEKIQYVDKKAPEHIKQEWENGTRSTNNAYKETKAIEKEAKNDTLPIFNRTNDNIEWAKWSWNPATGCEHGCTYCYARDIANRFWKQGFKPTYYPVRLDAPKNTKISDKEKNISGIHNVFVCSMADLFGDWVDKSWIIEVINTVKKHKEWNFLFLTKNPKRLTEFTFPDNAWVGATVDVQRRVKPTETAFKKVKAKVKFVSCEPLLNKVKFNELSIFDWLIIGGKSKSSLEPEMQPKWEWVESLLNQARDTKVKVYFKPNLKVRPKEYPKEGC